MSHRTEGFPPFTLVTASSEAVLSGCEEPGEVDLDGGVCSQYVPVGAREVERLSFLLEAQEECEAEIEARVFRHDAPAMKGGEGGDPRPLREGRLHWSGTGSRWIEWRVGLTPLSGLKVGGYLRVELELPPGIGWVRHRRHEPAFPGAVVAVGDGPASPPRSATFCFQVQPPQPCYWAANVLPEAPGQGRFTGIWRSDPAAGMPQWIEVSWKDPQLLEELAIDFSDADECPVAYRVEVAAVTGAERSLDVAGNEDPHAVHRFDPPVPADRIRLELLASRSGSGVAIERIQASFRGRPE